MIFIPPQHDLGACIAAATADCHSVLDFGCGFGGNLSTTQAPVRIGIDAYRPYLRRARRMYPDLILIHADVARRPLVLPRRSMDAVLLLDFLEHFEFPTAYRIIRHAKYIARKRVIAFVPFGSHPQESDVTGLGGHHWQTHRSTWYERELESVGFSVAVWQHFCDDKAKDHRVMFAIWEPAS
jgi:SAM-dependent methyltransferase